MSGELVGSPDWPRLDVDLMSNFDHQIDGGVAALMTNTRIRADYPGANFWADCWFADGQYHAAVLVHRVHRATIDADTPEALMAAVCEQFGDE